MKAKIVKIGNSKGVRIPKALLEQAGLSEDVLLEATNNAIVIRASREPRDGWARQFKDMASAGDDQLVEVSKKARNDWDRSEWQW